jgi:hypothetical protein
LSKDELIVEFLLILLEISKNKSFCKEEVVLEILRTPQQFLPHSIIGFKLILLILPSTVDCGSIDGGYKVYNEIFYEIIRN